MARPGGNHELLDRISGDPCRIAVLTGPAASGKTTAALAMYQQFRDNGSQCVLVVPNAAAAEYFRRKLLASSPGGVSVSPQVNTFSALAGRVLSAGEAPGQLLSPFRRRLLLCGVVGELADAGKLSALSGVVDTPGLVVALDRAISELKRAAVEPDTLAPAVKGRPAKERDLLAVYQRYQQRLHDEDAYDVEGQMWLARDRLRRAVADDAPLPGLDGLAALVVDGFTDFTPTQLEMLDLISRRADRVLITLPLADDGRDRMWFWTRRTLQALQETFGERMTIVTADRKARSVPAALCDSLFDLDATSQTVPEGLTAIAASGIEAEVAAVARRVKRLLLKGAEPGSIAVLARSQTACRPAVERLFAQHDIPVAAAPSLLIDVPIIRFLLDAASIAPGFASTDVLRVTRNSYFRPSALGDFDPTTVAVAEMLIREGNVLEGRAAYTRAADRIVRSAGTYDEDADEDDRPARLKLGPIEVTPGQLASGARMLDRLFELSETAGGDLHALAAGLELHQAALAHRDPRLVARDLRALGVLEQSLAGLDPTVPPPRVREALRAVICPPQRGESLVDVMDVLDARALRYDHVFLVGLSEGQFPARVAESSLLGEAQRAAWSDRGVNLDSRGDLASREMLLFYLAASRSDGDLTLSYLPVDVSGQPAGPGSFLLSLLEPLGGIDAVRGAGRLEEIPLGRFLPEAQELVRARDIVTAAVAGWMDTAPGAAPAAMRWAVAHQADKLIRAARGIWARHCRWRRGPCDGFDGRITDKKLLTSLELRYPGEAVFSASRLSMFGQCPWRFFATCVLKLAELAEPQRHLEPIARGQFVHDVLFRVMTDLRDASGEHVDLSAIDEKVLCEVLDKAVAHESKRVEAHSPYPALWQIQRDRIHRDIRNYLLDQRNAPDLPARAAHFELGFGLRGRGPELLDTGSTPEPVELATPAGSIRLRGKIDRIDFAEADGQTGMLVVDYKTGRLPTDRDILAGRNLQLPLYVAAAEQLLGSPALGAAFHRIGTGSGRTKLYFAAFKHGREIARTGGYDSAREQVAERVGRFVTDMRCGRFDLLPTRDCPSYCPFRRMCHYAPSRRDVKAAGAGEEGAA